MKISAKDSFCGIKKYHRIFGPFLKKSIRNGSRSSVITIQNNTVYRIGFCLQLWTHPPTAELISEEWRADSAEDFNMVRYLFLFNFSILFYYYCCCCIVLIMFLLKEMYKFLIIMISLTCMVIIWGWLIWWKVSFKLVML